MLRIACFGCRKASQSLSRRLHATRCPASSGWRSPTPQLHGHGHCRHRRHRAAEEGPKGLAAGSVCEPLAGSSQGGDFAGGKEACRWLSGEQSVGGDVRGRHMRNHCGGAGGAWQQCGQRERLAGVLDHRRMRREPQSLGSLGLLKL